MKSNLCKLLAFFVILLEMVVLQAIPSTHYVFDEPPENFLPKRNVGSCYVICEGKILFLKRISSSTWGETWGLPGGRIEKTKKF